LYGCGTQTITEPITNSLPVFVNWCLLIFKCHIGS
jgi:hypothetical protein